MLSVHCGGLLWICVLLLLVLVVFVGFFWKSEIANLFDFCCVWTVFSPLQSLEWQGGVRVERTAKTSRQHWEKGTVQQDAVGYWSKTPWMCWRKGCTLLRQLTCALAVHRTCKESLRIETEIKRIVAGKNNLIIYFRSWIQMEFTNEKCWWIIEWCCCISFISFYS